MGDLLLSHAPKMAQRREAVAAFAPAWSALAAPVVSFAAIAALGAASGGYFPREWGWSAFALLWIATVALLVRSRVRLQGLELALLAGLTALTGWIALSLTWSSNFSGSVLEIERALVYVAGVAAVLLLARRRALSQLLAAILAAVVLLSGYGLATRLFPERLATYDSIAVYRLNEPIGYWNGLGIFAVMGIFLALGFAARTKRIAWRAVAGATLVILLPTLYFTFGRGPWVALATGLVGIIALDPRRLQLVTTLLVLAPVPAIAIWLGSQSDGLTNAQSTLGEASRDGHRFALALLGLAAGAAAVTAAFAYAERRVRVGRPVRLVYTAALLLILIGLLAGVFARYGSPPTLVHKGYDAFKAPPVGNSDLTHRLFSFSGNGRAVLWGVAWKDYKDHPWLGSGAGTYERYWLSHRTTGSKVRDAHNLYVEVLAELGPGGLALLLGTFAVPLIAAAKARRHPLVPGALGAFAAFLVHASVDWDWELTAVTLTALLCGAAVVVAARERPLRPIAGAVRIGAVVVAASLAAFTLVGFVGNGAAKASEHAAAAGNWAKAESEARKATRWAPWSSEPWFQLGGAQLEQGNAAAARTSFERAIGKDPANWRLWYFLALASEGQERDAALAEAARLNPLSPEIRGLRAGLSIATGATGQTP